MHWIEYTDGPLDGLYSPVSAYEARCAIIAWVAQSPNGVVLVCYEQRDQPLLRYFRDMELMSR